MVDIQNIPVKWRDHSNDGWVAELVGCSLHLTEYGDKSWHVAAVGAQYGRMIDAEDGVRSFQDARAYIENSLRSMLETRIANAKETVKRYKELGLWDA